MEWWGFLKEGGDFWVSLVGEILQIFSGEVTLHDAGVADTEVNSLFYEVSFDINILDNTWLQK